MEHGHTMRTSFLTPVLLISLLLGLAGCETKKVDPKPADTKLDPPAAEQTATTEIAQAQGPCESYKTAFCETVGEKAQECAALGALVGILPEETCQSGLKLIEQTKTKYASARKVCDEMVEKLCQDIGPQTKSCEMVKQMVPNFPPAQCTQMMEKYPEVLAELKQEEQKNAPLSAELQTQIADSAATAAGPVDAPVTVVEFSDFECPYCQMAYEAVDQVKKKYPNEVRVVFRQFPLSFHQNAHLAHQAALAAGEQGKFWEYHDLLFKNQKALGREDLESYASQLKLDMGKFKGALDSKTFAAQVDKDIELGGSVFVQGTPTVFINGVRSANATQFAAMDAEIQKALEDAKGAKE